MVRRSWTPILERARAIVQSYTIVITLRQLFYRLVSENLLRNSQNDYRELGRQTGKLRLAGRFPYLADYGREVYRPLSFDSPIDARDWLIDQYRLDRTQGQKYNVFIGCEKDTLKGLYQDWFGSLGVGIVALKGQSGTALVIDTIGDIVDDGRDAVLLYAGDFDPSGMYIPESYVNRVGLFKHVERVALDATQAHGLPQSIQPVKTKDPNYARFQADCARWGVAPVQVEVEAMDPNVLRALIVAELGNWWDDKKLKAMLRKEQQHKKQISTWQ